MTRQRYHIEVKGIVQGVGFRPFVFCLAEQLSLTGWVYNHGAGVTVEIQGEAAACQSFCQRLVEEKPALARIDRVQREEMPVQAERDFVIRQSLASAKATLVSPDMGVCEECLADMRDPGNRRYRYAFTNCTNCGPRFTIIENLPYDRPQTTMKDFPLCADCDREYRDPHDRRFHAQPVACPICGPQLSFRDRNGRPLAGDPIRLAQAALKAGDILAVKGLGGYHLVCDARQAAAVTALRQRKYRWDKPFAVMMEDLAAVKRYCKLAPEEEALLCSQRRPIVLLRKGELAEKDLAEDLAPGNGRLGVMLPYTPLHYLLMENMGVLVMTSGNLSEEPIVFRDEDAFARLSQIADGYLTHNRGIFRRCDDTVACWAAGGPRLLRRARGYAPEPLRITDSGASILACGGEQKNTFCLTRGDQAFLSQHIGDMQNLATLDSFTKEIRYFRQMFNTEPEIIAYDLHPEYLSTRFALDQSASVPKIGVQHHHAHFASVLEEHAWAGEAVGLIFDGTGYGTDGRLWGGEVFVGDRATVRRVAHLLELPLVGGEQAIREPWRVGFAAAALSLPEERWESDLPACLRQPELPMVTQLLKKGLRSPLSSGMGRLFDGVAALCGVGCRVNYEGQAAVELEQLLDENDTGRYDFRLIKEENDPWLLDWRPMVREILRDLAAGLSPGAISARFHRGLVEMCLAVCRALREEGGWETVALSGGCWQNVWLLEHTQRALEAAGFRVLLNQAVPANDGGLAYGQAAVVAARRKRGDFGCA